MGGVCLVGEHFLIAKPQMNSVGFKPIRKKQILAEVLFICLFIYLTSLNTAHKNNVKKWKWEVSVTMELSVCLAAMDCNVKNC